MKSTRKLFLEEEKLLEFLIQKSSIKFSSDWKKKLLVQSMNDGGMGSLLLLPDGIHSIRENRCFKKTISEHQFTDQDGIEVIISLNIDNHDRLFELDIWKTDFSQLIRIQI